MPPDCKTFSGLDGNKKELYSFLSTEAANFETGETELVVKLREGVVCYPSREAHMLAPCSH